VFAYDPARDPDPPIAACGRVVPGTDVRLVGPEGTEVPPGDPGELFARGPGQMLGYYRDPELTGSVFVDGWFRTNDIARVDADGHYYIVGRASDMIVRGGVNVSPLEVERVLITHPAVTECAVVGAPDDAYGERVAAFVVLAEGAAAEPDALREHCARQLAPFKVPSTVTVVPALPRGATGKVIRKELAARALTG
jgi:long-chain acyl-CoA synthetase